MLALMGMAHTKPSTVSGGKKFLPHGGGGGDMTIQTLTKRQATQHGCLPSLLDDGTKQLKYVVYGEEKKSSQGRTHISCTGTIRLVQAQRTNQKRTRVSTEVLFLLPAEYGIF
jgi:hypothetical protein